MIKKKKGSVFNAGASYMQLEYLASIFDSSGIFYHDSDRALELLDWDPEKNDWGSEFWADIVETRSGHLLAVVADGQWGHSNTEYYAVLELSVDKAGWTSFHQAITNDAGTIFHGSIDWSQVFSSNRKIQIAKTARLYLQGTFDDNTQINEADAEDAWSGAQTQLEEEEDP